VLKVPVSSEKTVIYTPKEITCVLGGGSIPLKIHAAAIPYTDVVVTLGKIAFDSGKVGAVDVSKHITPTSAESVKLELKNQVGYLTFACEAVTDGTELEYKLSGTDKDFFKLDQAKVTVKKVAAATVTNPPQAKFDLAMDPAKSTATKMTLKAKCPQIGSAYVWFSPIKLDTIAKDTKLATTYAKYVSDYQKLTTAQKSIHHKGAVW
jgi:hypothetical protein